MGCDIHGYVEVDKRHNRDGDPWWKAAGNLFPFVGRSYDSFGCLFGVRNYSRFDPIAPKRGIPDDAGRTVTEDYESWGSDAHSASYITYSEIKAIDRSETAKDRDGRYSILDENKEPTGTKFSLVSGGASGWNEIVSENQDKIDAGEPVPNKSGERYIQRRKQTRGEALSGAWDWFLTDYCGLLADRFGDDAVRVVVWFDN